MSPTTIADVARVAKVSKATVSRVLAGQSQYIRAETRQRVLAAIEELGYHPSHAARSLKSKRSCTLGIVGYGLEFYGPSCTLSGAEEEASELGYTLLLHLIRQPETNNVAELLDEMQARYVDGLIWAVPEIGNNHAWLEDPAFQPSVPVVFLSAEPRPNRFVVAVDNYTAGLTATRHLIAQGCQNIGLITGPLDWWEARQRKLGWKDALESVGLPRKEGFVAEGNWSASTGESGLTQLLTKHPEMDGVFVCNDRMAVGALKVAREMGRRVPEDLAIIGFDNVQDAAYFYPALSTMHQDMIEVGRRAVRELSKGIEAQQNNAPYPPTALLLQAELVMRDSSRRSRG